MIKTENYTTKRVFELRKNKQFGEAYEIALDLFSQYPDDKWTKKAYAWCLIDIIKIESGKNLQLAQSFLNQLNKIKIEVDDEILSKQIKSLISNLDSNYSLINEANKLSKNQQYKEALKIFQKINKSGTLKTDYHESYGWIIFKYIKTFENRLDINEVKKLLFEYLKLSNERPSLLHSKILQIAIHCALINKDLNIFEFFKIWNPKYLRDEDFNEQVFNGKKISSLLSRLIKAIINNQIPFDVKYLINKIGNEKLIIESIRETFFWNIFEANKVGNINFMWNIFDYYVKTYSNYGSSYWHSEILKLADRYMTENNQWRFLNFVKNWNIENFRDDDWKEKIDGEYVYKAIAIKALKKIFDIIKSSDQERDLCWIVKLYKHALKVAKNDIWLLREYAILLSKDHKIDGAVNIYKDIILELSDQAYIWHEFGNIMKFKNIDIAISMFSKAITIQKNEDFLGEIRLDLSALLIDKKLFSEALIELNIYKNHRDKKRWKISKTFQALISKIPYIENLPPNNTKFYEALKTDAETYILSDIPYIYVILYDIYKKEDGKEKLVFSNFKDIKFTVSHKKFKSLNKAKKNEVFEAKLFYDTKNKKFLVLKIEKSEYEIEKILNNALEKIAVVDHINNEKKLFHYVVNSKENGMVYFDKTDLRPDIGDLIKIKYYISNNDKMNILKVEHVQEINDSLKKSVIGALEVKYKHNDLIYSSNDNFIKYHSEFNTIKPDFAFIKGEYIPKYFLEMNGIKSNIEAKVEYLFDGNKWKIYKIEKL